MISEEEREDREKYRDDCKTRIWIVVGSIGGLVTLLGMLTLFILQLRIRRVGRYNRASGNLILFKYKDIKRSTKYFSEQLGEGGFGSVFRGTLPNSRVRADKRLKNLKQGEKQFHPEVSIIGQIQHTNLVRLKGFCIKDWKARYKIMIGTARELNYLHEKFRDCIIHCYIKPDNILLDDEFNAKVADFGLAKILGREFSHVLTTIKGTEGYLAPERILNEAITAKVDVYSYGKLFLRLYQGEKNMELLEDGDYFPALVAEKRSEGAEILTQILEKILKGEANLSELARACKVACWCSR
ncbi:hypothetical protein AgCh_034617 [Apium graveolens]